MTFDEFWNIGNHDLTPDQKQAARTAWDAARISENMRCAELCEEVTRFRRSDVKSEDTYEIGFLIAGLECTHAIRSHLSVLKTYDFDLTQPGGPDPVAQQGRRLPAGLRSLSALED